MSLRGLPNVQHSEVDDMTDLVQHTCPCDHTSLQPCCYSALLVEASAYQQAP